MFALLPHESGRQVVTSAQVLVVHGRGEVPGVVVAYPRVVAPGTADHHVRAVHRVQGCNRQVRPSWQQTCVVVIATSRCGRHSNRQVWSSWQPPGVVVIATDGCGVRHSNRQVCRHSNRQMCRHSNRLVWSS